MIISEKTYIQENMESQGYILLLRKVTYYNTSLLYNLV